MKAVMVSETLRNRIGLYDEDTFELKVRLKLVSWGLYILNDPENVYKFKKTKSKLF